MLLQLHEDRDVKMSDVHLIMIEVTYKTSVIADIYYGLMQRE
jgi:hypothetical protein